MLDVGGDEDKAHSHSDNIIDVEKPELLEGVALNQLKVGVLTSLVNLMEVYK